MEKRETKYKQLSAGERAIIMLMTRDGKSVREVGRFLKRSPSTITRRTDRDRGPESCYSVTLSGEQAAHLRIKPPKALKLFVDGELFGVVVCHLKNKWSPEQIAGSLKGMYPTQPRQRVSHETIYHTLYAMPRGELRRELITCLSWSRDKRRSKTRALMVVDTCRNAEHSLAPAGSCGSPDSGALVSRLNQMRDEPLLSGHAG